MINDHVLDKISDKIKETIGIEKINDSKIFIDTDNRLPDYITNR